MDSTSAATAPSAPADTQDAPPSYAESQTSSPGYKYTSQAQNVYPPVQNQYPLSVPNQYTSTQSQYPPTQNQYPPPPSQYPPTQSQYPPPPSQYPPTQRQYSGYTGYPGSNPTYGLQETVPQTGSAPAVSSWTDVESNQPAFASFSEKSVRLGFVRKVFGILAVMLLLTAGIMCIFMFVEDVKDYVQDNLWVYIAAICVYFAAVFALICAGDLRRKTPHNFIFLGIVVAAMGVMLGTIASYYDVKEVLIAVGITVIITIGMVALGFQNKFDFTYLTGILFVATFCLIGFGIMAAIFHDNNILYIFYASLGAFIFSLWIVVDVQLMMGGNHKFSISPEEYIVAALNLYLDIVNLFLYLLMIIGSKN